MKITMVVMRMVPSADSHSFFQENRPCATASRMAPIEPMAPASVGEAMPMKMVPRTRKISTSEGTIPQATFDHRAMPLRVRAAGGNAGTRCGWKIETSNMKPENRSTCAIEGPMAPRYMSPTGTPSWKARTMSTNDGGMTCVMVPEAAITPVPSFMS